MKGRTLVKYKKGIKINFRLYSRKERKKIKALLKTISVESVQSKTAGRIHLALVHKGTNQRYIHLSNCRLDFKNKAELHEYSIAYPGGEFYTGHPRLE